MDPAEKGKSTQNRNNKTASICEVLIFPAEEGDKKAERDFNRAFDILFEEMFSTGS